MSTSMLRLPYAPPPTVTESQCPWIDYRYDPNVPRFPAIQQAGFPHVVRTNHELFWTEIAPRLSLADGVATFLYNWDMARGTPDVMLGRFFNRASYDPTRPIPDGSGGGSFLVHQYEIKVTDEARKTDMVVIRAGPLVMVSHKWSNEDRYDKTVMYNINNVGRWEPVTTVYNNSRQMLASPRTTEDDAMEFTEKLLRGPIWRPGNTIKELGVDEDGDFHYQMHSTLESSRAAALPSPPGGD